MDNIVFNLRSDVKTYKMGQYLKAMAGLILTKSTKFLDFEPMPLI